MTAPVLPRLTLWVPGRPAPQGSKRHVGRGILIESSKALGPWRGAVADAVRAEVQRSGWTPPTAATVNLGFRMPVPKALRAKVARRPGVFHTKRPDVDKLARAVLDALVIGGALGDDSHAAKLLTAKRYADADEGPGVHIRIGGISTEWQI